MEAVNKIGIDFEIRLAKNGKLCTRGRGEQLAVKLPKMELLLEIPQDVTAALGFA